MDDNCITDGYGNTECIGTAVNTHGNGTLPFTGTGDTIAMIVFIASILILVGICLHFEWFLYKIMNRGRR